MYDIHNISLISSNSDFKKNEFKSIFNVLMSTFTQRARKIINLNFLFEKKESE